MLPEEIIHVDQLPRQPDGSVDETALLASSVQKNMEQSTQGDDLQHHVNGSILQQVSSARPQALTLSRML